MTRLYTCITMCIWSFTPIFSFFPSMTFLTKTKTNKTKQSKTKKTSLFFRSKIQTGVVCFGKDFGTKRKNYYFLYKFTSYDWKRPSIIHVWSKYATRISNFRRLTYSIKHPHCNSIPAIEICRHVRFHHKLHMAHKASKLVINIPINRAHIVHHMATS